MARGKGGGGGRRSGEAQAALGRRAPTMKHRNTPRGGQRNEQAELLEEWLKSNENPPTFQEQQQAYCEGSGEKGLIISCKCRCWQDGRAKCPGTLGVIRGSDGLLSCSLCKCTYNIIG